MILTIPLKPKVASRARVRSGQGGYNTKAYDEWLDTAAQYLAIGARGQTLNARPGSEWFVNIEIGAKDIGVFIEHASEVFPPAYLPADGWTKVMQRPKGLTGDLDNYVKAVLDALQRAGVIENDKQVVALSAAFITEGDRR